MSMLLALLLSATVWHCGYERWAIKTGQDVTASQVQISAPTTIADLSSLVSPLPVQHGTYPPQINHRLAGEFSIITVSATITQYRSENDSDVHIILSDQGRTMIAEFPYPHCMSNLAGKRGMAVSPWVNQVKAARSIFLERVEHTPVHWITNKPEPPWKSCNIPATVTGVVFFDWPHAQHGAATNAVELHPILGISFP